MIVTMGERYNAYGFVGLTSHELSEFFLLGQECRRLSEVAREVEDNLAEFRAGAFVTANERADRAAGECLGSVEHR